MDDLVSRKDGSSLKLVMPVVIKAIDPFLHIENRMESVLNLEIGKLSGAIVKAGLPLATVHMKLPS